MANILLFTIEILWTAGTLYALTLTCLHILIGKNKNPKK